MLKLSSSQIKILLELKTGIKIYPIKTKDIKYLVRHKLINCAIAKNKENKLLNKYNCFLIDFGEHICSNLAEIDYENAKHQESLITAKNANKIATFAIVISIIALVCSVIIPFLLKD